MKSTLYNMEPTPFHVAIIMDGNGRWAQNRGLQRIDGHQEGVKSVRRVVEAAPKLGITVLTVYAFSSDNWKRPQEEVSQLMGFFQDYLYAERENCSREGIRLNVIGRRDRLSLPLRVAIETAERYTARGGNLHFRIAIDYSARDAILGAARAVSHEKQFSRENFSQRIVEAIHSADAPDVDLLIRTGGEKRLSDFLLWESAYAELVFTDTMWPDFTETDLHAAVVEFQRRTRRYGAVPLAV